MCSVDVVPVEESKPSPRVPTLLTNIGRTGGGEGKSVKEEAGEEESERIHRQGGGSNSTLYCLHSHGSLQDLSNNHGNSNGIGSNTESQEDLLDAHSKNLRNQEENRVWSLPRTPSSGTKIVSLISSYAETSQRSQSPPLSPGRLARGRSVDDLTRKEKKVDRVVSLLAPHSYAKPEKLVLEVSMKCVKIITLSWTCGSVLNQIFFQFSSFPCQHNILYFHILWSV